MSPAVDKIKLIYASLEPGFDTWNQLYHDMELWHRVRLLIEMTLAFRQMNWNPSELRVVDVGCGVGRSSRLLIELGGLPENILAIDFRPDANLKAKKLNTAIQHATISSLDDWPSGKFDLCVQCTVFSSIPCEELRMDTALKMQASSGNDGFIFWWDLIKPNSFSGGTQLLPEQLFLNRNLIYHNHVSLHPSFAEASCSLPRGSRFLSRWLKMIPQRNSHSCALFGNII